MTKRPKTALQIIRHKGTPETRSVYKIHQLMKANRAKNARKRKAGLAALAH